MRTKMIHFSESLQTEWISNSKTQTQRFIKTWRKVLLSTIDILVYISMKMNVNQVKNMFLLNDSSLKPHPHLDLLKCVCGIFVGTKKRREMVKCCMNVKLAVALWTDHWTELWETLKTLAVEVNIGWNMLKHHRKWERTTQRRNITSPSELSLLNIC